MKFLVMLNQALIHVADVVRSRITVFPEVH